MHGQTIIFIFFHRSLGYIPHGHPHPPYYTKASNAICLAIELPFLGNGKQRMLLQP